LPQKKSKQYKHSCKQPCLAGCQRGKLPIKAGHTELTLVAGGANDEKLYVYKTKKESVCERVIQGNVRQKILQGVGSLY